MSSSPDPAGNIDVARDAGARLVRRAAYAAIKDVPKARLDVGVVAFASAVITDLRGRLEAAQQLEAHHGRTLELAVVGRGEDTALSMYLAAGQGATRAPTLILPAHLRREDEPNRQDAERLAVARPLPEIIRDALTESGRWLPALVPFLREVSTHPGQPDVLITLAGRSLRYGPRAQQVLHRESLRPVYHLNEAETSPPHTTATVLSMRAADLLDRHFPPPSSS